MNFIEPHRDLWRLTDGDAAGSRAKPLPHVLMTLAQWETSRASWPAGIPIGVLLPNDADVACIADDLRQLALIALSFPKWVDGRAYSQAHLLRARYRFKAELRATGEVLVDMLPLLHRNGFDAVVLRADQSIDAARRALSFFPGHYQGDVLNPVPRFAQQHCAAESLSRMPGNAGVDVDPGDAR